MTDTPSNTCYQWPPEARRKLEEIVERVLSETSRSLDVTGHPSPSQASPSHGKEAVDVVVLRAKTAG